tara:strand:- start:44 stop:214 length:171 start_codon:yes stop_codon:yes gene_type:complete
MMEKKEITHCMIRQEDILKDINNIKSLLKEETGMEVNGPNVLRVCIRAWYDRRKGY